MAGDPSSLRLVGAILLTAVGAMTLFFVRRNEKLEWNERLAAHFLCWAFIIKGFGGISGNYAIQWFEDGNTEGGSPFWFYLAGTLTSDYVFEMLFMALAFVFPIPILRKIEHLKIAYGLIIALTTLRYVMFVLGIPLHTIIDMYGLYYLVCGLIWCTIYVKFRLLDDDAAKESSANIANVAGLLFIFVAGHHLLNWAGLVFRADYFLYIEMMGNLSGRAADYWWQALSTFTIASGLFILGIEIYQATKGDTSPLLYISLAYFVVGLIGYTVLAGSNSSAVWWKTGGDSLQATWITLTNSMHFTMIRPIIGVYIMLRYGLFDTTDEMKPKAKLMVIILIVIATSALLELIQAILPLNEMFTAVLLGVLVAFGIGWEEKSFDKLTNASKHMREGLDVRWFPDFTISKHTFTMIDRSMAIMLVFVAALSLLVWQTDVFYDWAMRQQ